MALDWTYYLLAIPVEPLSLSDTLGFRVRDSDGGIRAFKVQVWPQPGAE